ncbi:MAG: glycosyltransferase family 2 protein [Bacteroidetes bacterium]|nr:glycosyltransferase family 2 protein [Bacteroidota bacterium]
MNKNKNVFIILNYNGIDNTISCIDSIRNLSVDADIIVVDNCSTNSDYENLCAKVVDVLLIQTDYNRGYAGGMNVGLLKAIELKYEWAVIINNDTQLENDIIDKVRKCSLFNEDVSFVNVKVSYFEPNNLIYCAGSKISIFKICGVARYRLLSNEKHGLESQFLNSLEGSCIFIRLETFKKLGLFREKYFMYFEDVDYVRTIPKKYKILYCAEAKIFHHAGAGQNIIDYSNLYNYYYTRNRIVYACEFNIFYGIYSVLLSLFISGYKILKIGVSVNLEFFQKKKKIFSILKGFRDGLFHFFNYRKVEEPSPPDLERLKHTKL